MSGLGVAGTALLAAVCWFGLLLIALHNRWLSRFRQGYVLTLFATLLSVAAAGPFLIAVWSYEAAKALVTQQISRSLHDTGEIVQDGIVQSVQAALEQMANTAAILPAGSPGLLARDKVRDALPDMRALNPHFLHAHVFDKDGNLLETSGDTGEQEQVQQAVRQILTGQRFQRGPYYSAHIDKTVMQLGVPVTGADSSVAGALLVHFDLEGSVRKRFASTRFGRTGYIVIADSRGRIISHPDSSRTHDSVAEYQSTREALKGRDGFVLESPGGREPRFYFYRSISNPSVPDSEPLALLTELSEEEATGPARTLLNRFLLVLAVMICAAILIVVQLAGYSRRPIYELLDAVNRIRGGDLSARIGVTGVDEVGRLGQALNEMASGLQERDRIRDIFGRYVTTGVSERILRQEVSLGGEAKRVTVLFSDIRDFTTMSESLAAAEVVGFLNDYFSRMVDAVFEYGGVLDKYIGDGIMAVFGSLDEAPDHAERAVRSALRMLQHLDQINQERMAAGKPPVRIGIGIHTDTVVVGNIGSRKRLEYTAVGDGVNTASRIEGLNKQFGTAILISGNTFEAVRDAFECRAMPEASLKGKAKPLICYEVLSARSAEDRALTASGEARSES